MTRDPVAQWILDLVTVTLVLAPGGLVSGGLVSVTHVSGWFWWLVEMVDLVVGCSSESVNLAPVDWWLTTPLTRIVWVDWCLWLVWLVDRVALTPGKWVDLVSRWFVCLGVWWVYRSMTRCLGGLVGWWLWHLWLYQPWWLVV